jgi:hypothetical protein
MTNAHDGFLPSGWGCPKSRRASPAQKPRLAQLAFQDIATILSSACLTYLANASADGVGFLYNVDVGFLQTRFSSPDIPRART